MAFDYRRLRLGEQVAAVCAVLLFIIMFLDWYGPHAGGPGGVDAWQAFSFIDLLMFLLILLAIGLAILTATKRAPLPVAGSVILMLSAVLVTLLVAFRVFIDQPGFGFGVPDSAIDNQVAAYLGFLLVAGITAGGYLSMRDEGTTLAGAKAQAESMIAERRTAGGGAATTTGSTDSPPGGTAPPTAGAGTAPPPTGTAPPPEATAPPSATTPPPGEPPPPSGPANP